MTWHQGFLKLMVLTSLALPCCVFRIALQVNLFQLPVILASFKTKICRLKNVLICLLASTVDLQLK